MRERVLVQGAVEAAEGLDLVPEAHADQDVDDLLIRNDSAAPGVRVRAHRAVEQEGLLRDEVEPGPDGVGV